MPAHQRAEVRPRHGVLRGVLQTKPVEARGLLDLAFPVRFHGHAEGLALGARFPLLRRGFGHMQVPGRLVALVDTGGRWIDNEFFRSSRPRSGRIPLPRAVFGVVGTGIG